MGNLFKKLDAGYYRFEHFVVVTALALMSLMVFTDVVHRRLSAPDSALTTLILWPQKLSLRSELQQKLGQDEESGHLGMKVQERLASQREWLNERVSPVILGLLTFMLASFALRTREKLTKGDQPQRPRPSAWQKLVALGLCLGAGLLLVRVGTGYKWIILFAILLTGLIGSRFVKQTARLWLGASVTAGLVLIGMMVEQLPSYCTFIVLSIMLTIGLGLRPLQQKRYRQAACVGVGGLLVCLVAYGYVPEGFSWAKELAMVLLLWVGFLGTSMATYSRQQIMVDFVRKMIPERGRPIYEGISALLAAGFCILLTYLAYMYVFGAPAPRSIYSMHSQLPLTRLPAWVGVAAIVLGLGTTALRFVGLSIRAFRGDIAAPASAHGPMPPGGASADREDRS